MALIRGRKQRRKGYLLAVVRGVNVDSIVVNADSFIRVSGGEGHLEGGGQGGGGGEVEGVNSGVLEDEMWFRGAEYEPHEED